MDISTALSGADAASWAHLWDDSKPHKSVTKETKETRKRKRRKGKTAPKDWSRRDKIDAADVKYSMLKAKETDGSNAHSPGFFKDVEENSLELSSESVQTSSLMTLLTAEFISTKENVLSLIEAVKGSGMRRLRKTKDGGFRYGNNNAEVVSDLLEEDRDAVGSCNDDATDEASDYSSLNNLSDVGSSFGLNPDTSHNTEWLKQRLQELTEEERQRLNTEDSSSYAETAAFWEPATTDLQPRAEYCKKKQTDKYEMHRHCDDAMNICKRNRGVTNGAGIKVSQPRCDDLVDSADTRHMDHEFMKTLCAILTLLFCFVFILYDQLVAYVGHKYGRVVGYVGHKYEHMLGYVGHKYDQVVGYVGHVVGYVDTKCEQVLGALSKPLKSKRS